MDETKSIKLTETKLKRIAEASTRDPNMEFKWLMPHFNKESLKECFNSLDGRKATGVDGKTKDEYGIRLNENLDDLIIRMKKLAYRPKPVREVLIPKEGNKFRALGISVIEDKIVQSTTKKVLESIYEPIFRSCSYGFRPKRSCHMAIKEMHQYLYRNEVEAVIDVDLENFFGSIRHDMLLNLLKIKIKDDRFLRLIMRMLKAGILAKGNFRVTEEGTPQGSLVSPVLANIVGHYVIDVWFMDVVKMHVKGPVELYRYADDMVICCRYAKDAERIKQALLKRLAKFSLKLNEEKTKVVSFSKSKMKHRKEKAGTFDFLGFTFVLGKSIKGIIIPKVITSRKRFTSKLKKVNQWLRENRCKAKMKPLWLKFCIKLNGHIQYYGVSYNRRPGRFIFLARKLFFKWMNRRSQLKSLNWDKFLQFLKQFPPPLARVYHPLF